MAIELTPDVTKHLQASIKRYVAETLDQDIGDLQASLFLDYCLKEIGPSIYNQAIADAQSYLHDRVSDMEGAFSQKEFSYWAASTPRASNNHRKR